MLPSSAPDRLSPALKWTLMLVVAALLAGAVLIAVEYAFRARQAAKYGTADTLDQMFVVDPRWNLLVPVAGLKSGHVEVNSLGFRGPEIAMPKPPGTLRIAFLGASTTWCGEVTGNDRVWPHLVTAEIGRTFPGVPVDYVNGGVAGYSVGSSRLNLKHRVAPLDPDVIVIYHATNDMSGDLRQQAVAQGLIAEARMEPPSWLAERSVFWNLLEKNLRVWSANRQAKAQVQRLQVNPEHLGENFRRDLTALVLDAHREAPVVAVATFATHLRPGQDEVAQSRAMASALYYMPFMDAYGLLAAYARYNEIIREVATQTGALLIEGEQDIPGTPEYFNDSVHFNDRGSAAMAKRVTAALLQDSRLRALAER